MVNCTAADTGSCLDMLLLQLFSCGAALFALFFKDNKPY